MKTKIILWLMVVFFMFQGRISAPAATERVSLKNLWSQLKLDGRVSMGYRNSQSGGSFPNGSFEVPDARISFFWHPDQHVFTHLRFNLNNATAQTPLLDYFYLQANDFIPKLKGTPFSLSGRLGRFKIFISEEIYVNNPTEGSLVTDSTVNPSLIDEGIELSTKFLTVGVSNGTNGVGSDTTNPKAWFIKAFYRPVNPLYLQTSYYNSGALKASSAELPIAGSRTPQAGTTDWTRQMWITEARWDFGKGKDTQKSLVFSDSLAILLVSYGIFKDDSTGGASSKGQFGLIEGLWNIFQSFYIATRLSGIFLDGKQTMNLNGITANEYHRYSFGGGYRFSKNMIFKLGFDLNQDRGPGTSDRSDNLLSALLTLRF